MNYEYENILFMGNGESSTAKCYELVERLMKAFVTLSGLQQPAHWNHEPTKEELNREKEFEWRGRKELERLTQDIAVSLTGKKIELK